MKNVLIYIHPDKEFNEENKTLIKIHIDNSIRLGWKPEDILLFTNFEYSYGGISAQVVDGDYDLKWDRTSNKIFVIRDLLKYGLLKEDLYWYHDFDAYQNEPIKESELKMKGFDFGITGYGYKPQTNGGSFFFRENTFDIFDVWCERTRAICRTRSDEKSLTDMTRDGTLQRYTWLNITYNFGQRCPDLCYDDAWKPLKVLHFHPYYTYYESEIENIDIFMYGKNKQKKTMMSQGLIDIFKKHGIK